MSFVNVIPESGLVDPRWDQSGVGMRHIGTGSNGGGDDGRLRGAQEQGKQCALAQLSGRSAPQAQLGVL